MSVQRFCRLNCAVLPSPRLERPRCRPKHWIKNIPEALMSPGSQRHLLQQTASLPDIEAPIERAGIFSLIPHFPRSPVTEDTILIEQLANPFACLSLLYLFFSFFLFFLPGIGLFSAVACSRKPFLIWSGLSARPAFSTPFRPSGRKITHNSEKMPLSEEINFASTASVSRTKVNSE